MRTSNSESFREQGAFEISHVTIFERSDLLILFGLAIVTFGIYAQVIGHRSITIDDVSYINITLRLPSCRNENRQVLKPIDAIRGRIDHHSGALGMS